MVIDREARTSHRQGTYYTAKPRPYLWLGLNKNSKKWYRMWGQEEHGDCPELGKGRKHLQLQEDAKRGGRKCGKLPKELDFEFLFFCILPMFLFVSFWFGATTSDAPGYS